MSPQQGQVPSKLHAQGAAVPIGRASPIGGGPSYIELPRTAQPKVRRARPVRPRPEPKPRRTFSELLEEAGKPPPPEPIAFAGEIFYDQRPSTAERVRRGLGWVLAFTLFVAAMVAVWGIVQIMTRTSFG